MQKFRRKIVINFLSIRFNMCFGCLKEQSHRDGSFEYPQHMFWLRNNKMIFSYTLFPGGPNLQVSCFSEIFFTFSLKEWNKKGSINAISLKKVIKCLRMLSFYFVSQLIL